MLHPLNGADLISLFRLFARDGAPRRGKLPVVTGAVSGAAARSPISLLERAYVAGRRPGANMPAPIFIIGHWRSGTTHLFNLLSGAPSLTYAAPIPTGLPWDFLLLGRPLSPLLEKAIPSQRGIDPMAVTPDAPQEDEIALASMGVPSYYHGVYCPRAFRREMARGLFFDGCTPLERDRWRRALRQFTGKISAAGGRRVLIKNPAHTAKMQDIRRIWPDAKFVHIYRDPYHVYHSTQRMFDDLLDMLALQPVDRDQITTTIQESYPRMMAQAADDMAALPESQAVETRFEDLESDPLGTVGRIAAALDLPNQGDLLAAARTHLDSVASYSSRTRDIAPEVIAAVNAHWDRERARLGYARRETRG